MPNPWNIIGWLVLLALVLAVVVVVGLALEKQAEKERERERELAERPAIVRTADAPAEAREAGAGLS